MIEAAEKCPDARRGAPISACVFYQIDRLKSGFEAMGRTVMPGNCALMGATRLASGIFQQPRPVGKYSVSYTNCWLTDSTQYTPVCKSLL